MKRSPISLRRVCWCLCLLFLLSPISATAGEGMWLPEQLPSIGDELRKSGLELPVEEFHDLSKAPLGAIISLGGCSASFVSDTGLTITNHHCAARALQHNSTPERDRLHDGFSAATLADEVWAGPGSRIYITESLTDVSDEIFKAAEAAKDDDVVREQMIDERRKVLIAKCEAQEGRRCSVVSYFNGQAYRLIQQLEIEDVRLVFAPPLSIGKYGGDIDNWMWPRHTGDFAFLRAYVSPEGKPAPYSVDNVPYQPTHKLTVSPEGVKENDFVMVAGYPGRTYRYRTAMEMSFAKETRYPWQIQIMGDLLSIIDGRMKADEDAKVKLSSLSFGLANYHKNNKGMLDNFNTSGAVAQSTKREEAMSAFLTKKSTDETKAWNADVEELNKLLEISLARESRDRLILWMGWVCKLPSTAIRGHRLTREKAKADDLKRLSGYQARDWPRIKERFERVPRELDPKADEMMFAYFLKRGDELPKAQHIPAFDELLAKYRDASDPYTAAASALYKGTKLTDDKARMALLEADQKTVEADQDPIMMFAVALAPTLDEIIASNKAHEGAMIRLRPSYMAALKAFAPGPVYPDANSTLRITFGNVQGYPRADGHMYLPFTTLEGMSAKATGVEPFDAPAPLLKAVKEGKHGAYALDEYGSVPINFLSTLDTTGGNSGSATLNAKGELVGLLFDGNIEAMASDWLFDPVRTRSIHADVRYILWLMDVVYPQHRLLDEMGIKPTP